MDAQLKKGIPEVCVLKVLSNGPSYGYKIITDMAALFPIGESTLYPILRRLELAGALSTDSQEHNGRLRKYFSITDIGSARLEEAKKDWAELAEIYTKLFGKEKEGK